MATAFPTGTVTFLFTDIEGSTQLLQDFADRYAEVLATHHHLLRAAFQQFNGQVIDTQGDSFFVTFARARDAVAAAIAAQYSLQHYPWPNRVSVRVRMGIHTGEPMVHTQQYIGLDVHKAARIAAVGHGGQILVSESTRALIQGNPPAGASLNDLGRHRLKDLTVPIHLFQVVAPGLQTQFKPLRSLDALPNNLPIQLTSFIGREEDLGEIRRILGTAHLLTLTGAGGSGKTRLALQVAAEATLEFPDGVWLVELAALTEQAAVPRAVASVLDLREHHEQPLTETLVTFLQPRRLLLILDNCEHLVVSCAQLCEQLLRTCPHLRILATSRESLNVTGEVSYRVPTLAGPPTGTAVPLDLLADYPAVRLFVERAQSALPTFRLTAANAPAIADICLGLDGIPLAIEFAAARVKAMGVELIAARLSDRFRFLSGGRTALPRHQTLRAAMDWSFELLTDHEQRVLRRLAVLAGGFTLEAAEVVCASNEQSSAETLDVLSRLVDKSLVILEEGGARYRLLETVRQYADEKLMVAGEMDLAQRRHRDYFLKLAEKAEAEFHGPNQIAWLDRLEADHDNLRAALQWSLHQKADPGGVLLGSLLWWYWIVRGYLVEGREWLMRILSQAQDAPVLLRTKVLTGVGALASAVDDFAPAVAFLGEAVAMSRAQGDRQALAVALALLGHATWHQGKPDESVVLAEESLALAREIGDAWALARSSYDVSIVAWHVGDYARMRSIATEWLARSRANGDLWGAASSLFFLGEAGLSQRAYDQAAKYFRERLQLVKEMRERYAVAVTQLRLAHAVQALGDVDQATTLYHESLEPLRWLGDRWWLAFCMEGLAAIAIKTDQPTRAATLLGAADALRATIGATPAERPDYDLAVAASRAALGLEGYRQTWEYGRALSRDEAIAYASQHGPDGHPMNHSSVT